MTRTDRITFAIQTILPDIAERVSVGGQVDENVCWWELSCCILSSQVPYTLASAAADAIRLTALFRSGAADEEHLRSTLQEVLEAPLWVEGKERRYRFPFCRARQLASAHSVITTTNSSLCNLLSSFPNAEQARAWFVANVPGLGPKQASMFLRNTGLSLDLAILDRHVVRYMSALGLADGDRATLSRLEDYRLIEERLRAHISTTGSQVGLFDLAIWIVMRVAN